MGDSTFVFGDTHLIIDAQGNVNYNGNYWGTVDLDSGVMTDQFGNFYGTLSNDGGDGATLILADGSTTYQGSYDPPTAPPAPLPQEPVSNYSGVFDFGDTHLDIDIYGNVTYNGNYWGSADLNTGVMTDQFGNFYGTLTGDGGPNATLVLADGTTTYQGSYATPGNPSGGVPNTGPYSPTSYYEGIFDFGDTHLEIDVYGNVNYNGDYWGTVDISTGVMTDQFGNFYGTLTGDGGPDATLVLADGTTTYQGSYATPGTPPGDEIPTYDIPEDPTTTTTTDTTQDTTTGIDWNSPVGEALLQSLLDSSQALPGLAEQTGVEAQERYTNLMNNAMRPQNFQGYIDSLAGKNILNSSVAASTLANAQQQAAQSVADQAFQASLASSAAQMDVPGHLSSIIGSLGGNTTTGNTGSNSTYYDPLAPYNLMNDLLF